MVISRKRLIAERKSWRKDHPAGFFAKPLKNNDGSLNIYKWKAGVPGKKGTIWENATYKLELIFSENFPKSPPVCRFNPPIFHPNVYRSGDICLSIIGHDWNPSLTLKQILIGIQDLLDNPNTKSPAADGPNTLYMKEREKYEEKIRQQAKRKEFAD